MIEGTAIHFFGDDSNKSERDAILQTAAERKIDIKIHGQVSKVEGRP